MSDVSDLRELSEWLKGGDEHAMARHVDDAADTIEALRAEVAKAGERIETMRQVLGLRDEQMLTLRAEVECKEAEWRLQEQLKDKALAEVERLRAALTKYGRHTKYCRLLDSFDERTECTCGFERATGRQEKSLSEES